MDATEFTYNVGMYNDRPNITKSSIFSAHKKVASGDQLNTGSISNHQ